MTTGSPSTRFTAAVSLIIGVLLISLLEGTLTLRQRRARGSAPPSVLEAQGRFLASFPILFELRDSLDLSEEDRAELEQNDPLRTGLIGLAFTPLTTTDGSLDAKRLSTDPRWVADISAMLRECRQREGNWTDPVAWIGASGSFPALAIAAMLACEAEGVTALVIPSLTASSYGANLPGGDLLSMQRALTRGGLFHASQQVIIAASVGGEEDRGLGLDPGAVYRLRQTIADHGVTLIDAPNAESAAEERVRLWREASGRSLPDVFINIGGNQANLGPETEARHLASGLNTRDAGAVEAPRGVATQMLQGGVPVIHLLNLRGLAAHLDRSALGADPRTVATLVIIDRWRRAVALIGLIAVALWVALRLTPQATSLNSHPIPEGAPKP